MEAPRPEAIQQEALMDEQSAKELRQRAVWSSAKKGFREAREDLAHDTLLRFIEGHGKHQTIDQATTDSIRSAYGRSSTSSHGQRKNLEQRAESIDALENKSGPEIHGESRLDFNRIVQPLGQSDRAILKLIYEWGFQTNEVADCFGVSETRISQRIKAIQTRLSKTLGVRELSPDKKIQEEVFAIRQRQRVRESERQEGLSEKEIDRALLSFEEGGGMAEEKSLSMEIDNEEGFPEWFA